MSAESIPTPVPLLPVRMLNEHVYCPRLFALMWLNAQWADSADTVEGRTVHRRVDKPSRKGLPEPEPAETEDPPVVVRSLDLGDPELGLIAKIDLVEAEGDRVVPVDYKRGWPPDSNRVPEGAYDPERVQVCAQGLLLRAHGYRCDHGVLYFAGARRRVLVPFTDALIALTLEHRDRARAVAASASLPPPLVDSPKCNGCSLVGICLPDEHNLLTGQSHATEVRPLLPARDDGMPLYVQSYGGRLTKSGDEIVIMDREGETGRARLEETSRIVLMGNISITTPLLQELAKRDIPVGYHSHGGWFYGQFRSSSGQNVLSRIAQHRVAADPERTLAIARLIVAGKIRNCRTLLRRNGDPPKLILDQMKLLVQQAEEADSIASLMGIEGLAARDYFSAFSTMLKDAGVVFSFEGRNRRPPRDPVNALLSFAYACLSRELTHIIGGVGLDAWVGFLHQPRPGRPALALDLMEEFRPIVADSAVINAVNNRVVTAEDFTIHPTGVALSPAGRKRFIGAIERRLDELCTHPTFGSRLSYRRIIEVQVRLLAKVVLGELDTYPPFVVR